MARYKKTPAGPEYEARRHARIIAFKVAAWTCVATLPVGAIVGDSPLGLVGLSVLPSFLGAYAMRERGIAYRTAISLSPFAMLVGLSAPGAALWAFFLVWSGASASDKGALFFRATFAFVWSASFFFIVGSVGAMLGSWLDGVVRRARGRADLERPRA